MDKALLSHAASVLEIIASLKLSSSHLNKLIKGGYLADFFLASVTQQFAETWPDPNRWIFGLPGYQDGTFNLSDPTPDGQDQALLDQGTQVLELMAQAKLSASQLCVLLDNGHLANFFTASLLPGFAQLGRDNLRVAFGLPKLLPDHAISFLGEVIIPPDATLDYLIRLGQYHGQQRHITLIRKNLTINCRGVRKLSLLHFMDPLRTAEVYRALSAIGDKDLALVEDLLALGADPQLKMKVKEAAIYALGSTLLLDQQRRVPCLGNNCDPNWLDLTYYERNWPAGSCFLLVESTTLLSM